MAGTYREDRRKSGGRVASSLKSAGRKAARAFFGASPTQKKKLRKTVDKRGVKMSDLNVDGLDRSKFNAPEKVGESINLIDIAMGNAPAGPAPGLAPPPPPPPPIPERPTRRPPRPTASRPPQRTASGRLTPIGVGPSGGAAEEDDEEYEDDDEDAGSDAGVVTGLSSLLALVCLVFVLAGGPLLRMFKPDLAVAAAAARGAEVDPWGNAWCVPTTKSAGAPSKAWSAGPNGRDEALRGDDVRDLGADVDANLLTATAWSREGALVLGFFFTWVAMSLGRLRHPRAGFVRELLKAAFFASVPALGGAGLLLWSVGALPSVPAVPPAELAPHGATVLELVAPLADATGLAATHAAALVWGLVCFVLALIVRRLAARAEPIDA